MTAPDGKIRIPLNEEGQAGGGQIEEFLRAYNGEGIQHIAFVCDDLLASWDRLKALGTPLMTPPPATYYAMLDERLPGHGQPVEELQKRGILLDGSTEGGDPRLLLQIFSRDADRPGVLRIHPTQEGRRLWRGQFHRAVRNRSSATRLRAGVLKAGQ